MNFTQINEYILSKKSVTYDYPFDKDTRVYRIGDKLFALINEHKTPLSINLKCHPIYALELRSIYEGINGGYHMNKKHWNTITLENSDVDEETIKELIDHSYELVYNSLTRRVRERLELGD